MAEGLNMTVQEVLEKLRAEWEVLDGQYKLAFELVGRAVDNSRDNRGCYAVDIALAKIDALRQRQEIISKFGEQLKEEVTKRAQVLDAMEAA